jgi:hypothetical protein
MADTERLPTPSRPRLPVARGSYPPVPHRAVVVHWFGWLSPRRAARWAGERYCRGMNDLEQRALWAYQARTCPTLAEMLRAEEC